MLMLFAIRDDDTCAFTRPEEIESIYQDISDICPVSLSVTPFRVTGSPRRKNAVPAKYYGSTDELPLENNQDLISFLKEEISKGRISITLHGYNHTVYPEGPEYFAGHDLTRKTAKGKNYLESIFGIKVQTFVPPNNTIGINGLKAIIANNLNLINIPSCSTRPYILNIPKFIKIRWYRSIYNFPYPFVLNLPDHKEVAYFSLVPTVKLDYLLRRLMFVYKKNGVFILSTHYHEMSEYMKYDNMTMKEALYILWERVNSIPNVRFCSVDDVFRVKK